MKNFNHEGFYYSYSVSVPLRGNGYEKLVVTETRGDFAIAEVSVPLRGNGYEKL